MIKLKGIAAATGIAIGPAFRLGKEELVVPKLAISEQDIPLQIQIFEEALIKTRKEIIEIQKKIGTEMGQEEAQIFDAHLAMWEYDTRDRENDVQGYAIRHRIEYVDCYLAGKVPSIVYYNPDILKMAWNNRAYQYLKE